MTCSSICRRADHHEAPSYRESCGPASDPGDCRRAARCRLRGRWRISLGSLVVSSLPRTHSSRQRVTSLPSMALALVWRSSTRLTPAWTSFLRRRLTGSTSTPACLTWSGFLAPRGNTPPVGRWIEPRRHNWATQTPPAHPSFASASPAIWCGLVGRSTRGPAFSSPLGSCRRSESCVERSRTPARRPSPSKNQDGAWRGPSPGTTDSRRSLSR